jgi:3-oxoacyl-[acyl-carrier-protein] synthase II
MTCRMAVRGIGLVGGFGSGMDAALNALRNGGKPNNSLVVEIPNGRINYPVYQADIEPLKSFISPGKLRRVSRYSQLATLAACLALQDAGYKLPYRLDNTAVIIASGYGATSTTFSFLDDIIAQGDSLASPTHFSNSVHSSAASNITILLQIQGACLTVTQFEMSTVAALFNAWGWLREGRVDTVLVGGVDQINQVLLYCYHSFWNIEIPNEIMPLQYDIQTAIPGEGAAFMVLTRDESQEPSYGYIDELSWDNLANFTISDKATIISGADGHRACGLHYKRLFRSANPDKIRSFSTIYGSMPCGQIFDIALACLAAKHGLIPSDYCSIKLDDNNNVGIIHHS